MNGAAQTQPRRPVNPVSAAVAAVKIESPLPAKRALPSKQPVLLLGLKTSENYTDEESERDGDYNDRGR